MKIRIAKDAACGEIPINGGEYWVALRHERQQIALVSGGKDLLIPAKRRKANSRTKTVTVQFYTGGGSIWSLVIMDPKYGEWISLIDYNPKHSDKHKRK